MTTYRTISAIALSLIANASVVAAQVFLSVEPPPAIRAQLEKLKRGEDRTAVVLTLGRNDRAAPYVRMELAVAANRFITRDLEEALREIEARARERNKARLAWWAKTRRFDLCNELLFDWPDKKEAEQLADIVAGAMEDVAREAADGIGLRKVRIGRELQDGSLRSPHQMHFADIRVTVPLRAMLTAPIVRADVLEDSGGTFQGLFGAIRSANPSLPSHSGSVVLVGNSISMQGSDYSVIICDGDIAIDQPNFVVRSVLIANGTISSQLGEFQSSLLGATGDIKVCCERAPWKNQLYSGGKVTLIGKETANVHEKQKSLPLGIKFVDPKEFGLDLAFQNGGVQVMGITKESPFAKFGVEDADVITRIDDVVPKSLPDFRRALRRGVVRESVILHIKRNGKDLTRIVFLDGIPVPLAPPPRPK